MLSKNLIPKTRAEKADFTGKIPQPLCNRDETVLFQIEFETQLSHETRLCPVLDKKSLVFRGCALLFHSGVTVSGCLKYLVAGSFLPLRVLPKKTWRRRSFPHSQIY
jgi:hypothetical protein